MITDKSKCLLFNKEISQKGFKYRLYFVSLQDCGPRIRRLIAPRRRTFHTAELGKVYDISYKRKFLKTLYETGEEMISEGDYRKLIEEKDRVFKHDQTVSVFRPLHPASASAGGYYSFDEFRQISAYTPEFYRTALYHTVHSLALFLSFIVPFLALAWSLFFIFSLPQPTVTAYRENYWLLPVYYFASVPFVIYLMTLFGVLAETGILRLNSFRWIALKHHAFMTGGMRRGIRLQRRQKYRLLWYGIATGGVYFAILLLILL